MSDRAQKSEAHTSTGDASTSPTSAGDRATVRDRPVENPPSSKAGRVEPQPSDAVTIDDQTDAGGPLKIESDDPDLQPPIDVPSDPFPTERTPEIDPPVQNTPSKTRR